MNLAKIVAGKPISEIIVLSPNEVIFARIFSPPLACENGLLEDGPVGAEEGYLPWLVSPVHQADVVRLAAHVRVGVVACNEINKNFP